MHRLFAALVLALTLVAACSDDDPGRRPIAVDSNGSTNDSARDDLVALVRSVSNEPISTGVLVSLEDFFVGNVDEGSVAPNLADHPGVQEIYTGLLAVRARPEVVDVLVDVAVEFDGDYPDGEWPLGQAVIVVTSVTPEEVDHWVGNLRADASFAGLWTEQTINPPVVADGFHTVVVWWD